MEMNNSGRYLNEIPEVTLNNLLTQAKKDSIQKIVGGAHVFRDGKLLLLIRAKGEFMEGLVELPSGNIDPGESLVDGLVREVKEETGLDALSVKKYIDYFDYTSGSGKKARQFNFIVEVGDGNVVLNPSEHGEYMFIDPNVDSIENLGISESVKESIKKTVLILNTKK